MSIFLLILCVTVVPANLLRTHRAHARQQGTHTGALAHSRLLCASLFFILAHARSEMAGDGLFGNGRAARLSGHGDERPVAQKADRLPRMALPMA
jgi:hypothetical protein